MKTTVFIVAVLLPNLAWSEEKTQLPRLMWSSFECYSYAVSAGLDEDAEQQFQLGYQTGQRIFEVASNDPNSELLQDPPWGLSFVWHGPSEEFVLGRAFEFITTEAEKKVSERSIEPKYNEDNRQLAALLLYQEANCGLILR